MNIGDRIKIRRKQLKMSADELASKLGKDRSTIYRYEKGDIENLPLDILSPIATALETTPEYLMGWSKENSPDELVLTEGEKKLIQLLRQFPSDRREFAVSMVLSAIENMP